MLDAAKKSLAYYKREGGTAPQGIIYLGRYWLEEGSFLGMVTVMYDYRRLVCLRWKVIASSSTCTRTLANCLLAKVKKETM